MAKRKQSSRKRSKVSKAANSAPSAKTKASRPRVLPVGRVNPDLAMFIWNPSEEDVRFTAESISKAIEMQYQIDLIQRSGLVG